MDCKLRPGQIRNGSSFCEEERRQVIEDYLSSGKTKSEIWHKYTGQDRDHGQILKWMRFFGYPAERKKTIFEASMKKNKKTTPTPSEENSQLKSRIKELEKALEESNFKALAYSTMIDVAEETLNIPIRKK